MCSDGCCCPFFNFSGRCFTISTLEHQINEEIRDKEVRLIDSDGSQLGIVSIQAALDKAAERGLDLVKIAPKAEPPVCRVMDYGKFRFERDKKEKEAKKNQHVVEIKEIRMSPGIDIGDFNTKLKNAQKFIADGNRVKVSVRFRGREMAHTDIGKELLERFVRGDSSRNTEGSGLGLSIARSLVELHGGSLKLTVDGDLFRVDIILPATEK
mgnify:CR=1 FL=1